MPRARAIGSWSASPRYALITLGLMTGLAASTWSADALDGQWNTTIRPLLKQYCWECHGEQKQKGDLDLQGMAGRSELTSRVEDLLQRVVGEEMPPAHAPKPTPAERAILVAWLRKIRPGGSGQDGDPGIVVMPRVTPSQYEHIVADVTGRDIHLAGLLPHDGGAGEGFDNVGSAQITAPLHLQAYVKAANQVLSYARIMPGMPIDWGSDARGPVRTTHEVEQSIQADWAAWLLYQTRSEISGHMAALAELLPTAEQWRTSLKYDYYYVVHPWLIVYLDAAWQYRHRAELGHASWTMDDEAAGFKPPLHAEVLKTVIINLDSTSKLRPKSFYWQLLVSQWEALPPPPATDAVIRQQCFEMLLYFYHHTIMMGNDSMQGPERLPPFEINPETWLTHTEEFRTVVFTQGLRPFRFKLEGIPDLYLTTTDGNDGADEDYMIWEHGILERNGREEPWTSLAVTDGDGKPVPWGSHPMGAAAGLANDSIAVHAPAVLHLALPPGTTGLRVDARADPVYAKNGSMQAVAFTHLPTGDELHFVAMRYLFASPTSGRRWLLEKQAGTMFQSMAFLSIWNLGRQFISLIPPEVRERWKLPPDGYDAKDRSFDLAPLDPNLWETPILWNESDQAILARLTPEARSHFDSLCQELRGTVEQRDLLADFLRQHAGFADENPAKALTVVPGPLEPTLTDAYQKLLHAAQADETRLRDSARVQIRDFAERAWRGVIPDRSLAAMVDLYGRGRDEGLCYSAAMQGALVPVLVSPHFLFRAQTARGQAAPYSLDGRELAERLSFTLWGSLPDTALLEAGAEGRLTDPVKRRAEIARMLADPRARALASDFAAQSFLFAGFDRFNGPDPQRFPQFTDSVRMAMYRECLEFFSYIFQQDRPLTDIIDADYTFVNEELAGFYGIPGVSGSEFRKVAVDRRQRGGVLGLGAILVSTSPPLRTSPIKRGNWVLSQLLGTPPPPPPPVVPQFSHDEHDEQGQTLYQQMKIHRSDGRCISCHAQIDPLGVALEQFDAIGRARALNADGTITPDLETTSDGTALQGLDSLKRYLLADTQRRKFLRNLCAKFLGYALGRGRIPSDEATIDALVADLEAHGWNSSTLITGVLTSPQFSQRRDSRPADSRAAPERKP